MPTYEYECRACDYRFEELQSIHDNPLRKCPQCGKLKLARLISAGAGIIFKGSGFYVTDNKSKSSGGPSKQEKSESAPSAATSESSSSGDGGSKSGGEAPGKGDSSGGKSEKPKKESA